MIITRSPYRISLLGGGADIDEYIQENGSALTISFAINKYSYIFAQKLENFPTRLIYKDVEMVQDNFLISHKAIFETIKDANLLEQPLEIFHASDLGSNLGLGSSSAFIVAIRKALAILNQESLETLSLVQRAVRIEQSYSNVGYQDAAISTIGSFKPIRYNKDGTMKYYALNDLQGKKYQLEEYGLLFDIGLKREASRYVEYYKNPESKGLLKEIQNLAEEGLSALFNKNFGIETLSKLMGESWKIKRQINPNISNPFIDNLIDICYGCGCWSAKLCGAGGGGCIFVLSDGPYHKQVIKEMESNDCKQIPFKIDSEGVKQLQ